MRPIQGRARSSLSGNAVQEPLVPEAPCEHHSEWKPGAALTQRQRDGRLSGGVEDRRERQVFEHRSKGTLEISLVRVERPQLYGWQRECGREPGVDVLEEGRDLTRQPLDHRDRELEVGAGDLLATLVEAPGQWLEELRRGRAAEGSRGAVDPCGVSHRPDVQKSLLERVHRELRLAFLYLVSELAAEPRDVPCRGRALRIDRPATQVAGPARDAESAGVARDLFQIGTLGRGRPVRVPDIGTRRAVEDCGAVTHRAGDYVFAAQAAERVAEQRPQRIPRPRWLHPDEPAARGGNPDRASTVVRVGERNDPGRDGGCRATARSPGGVVCVPRVPRSSVELRLGRRHGSELWDVGLAERDQAGALVADDELGILRGDGALHEATSERRGNALVVTQDVLEQERNALVRSASAGRWLTGRPFARKLVHRCDDGVQNGIVSPDSLDRFFHEF